MATAFVLSFLVQYNDPDPLRWLVIYGLAAFACIQHFRHKLSWTLPLGIAVVAVLWSILLAPGVVGKGVFRQMFTAIEMKSLLIEEAREMTGLLIVAFWMAVLAAVSRRQAEQKVGRT